MNTLFQGSQTDIYIHWLILSLGIGIFVFSLLVFTSCRSVARILNITDSKNNLLLKIYKSYSRFHSYYWLGFWLLLILHLMVTVTHIGLPDPVAPYYFAQQITFYTAITNLILIIALFGSCRSFASIFTYLASKNLFNNKVHLKFYKIHNLLWLIIAASFATHIVFGIIHAINT